MIFLPDSCKINFLHDMALEELQGGYFHLFDSDIVPDNTDTLATYEAIEATFGGYEPIGPIDWDLGGIFINSDSQAEIDSELVVWTSTGDGLPVTIFGLFYVASDGELAFVDTFGALSQNLEIPGDVVEYLPRFVLQPIPG